MAYRVIVTPRAEADVQAIYRYLLKAAPDAARAWLVGMRRTLKSLSRSPERGRLAPESASLTDPAAQPGGEPIRELFYGRGNRGTYRIFYIVMGSGVFVLHVRHGSMLPPS
jgi:plasmid stabilization system protein ParE